MKILVTGAAGYIGSVLVNQLLGRGDSVIGVDSLLHGGESLLAVLSQPRFRFVHHDIRDGAVSKGLLDGVDGVVHLAAIVGEPACNRDPEVTQAVNSDASRTLIDACARAGVARFVFASTCSNYGRMADPEAFLKETAELSPISTYATTKVDIEKMLLEINWPSTFCPTVLRFATVYGLSPRPRFDLTVNDFTAQMATEGTLTVFGEQFWRPYVHVRDAAAAIVSVLSTDPDSVRAEVFNVGSTAENYRKKDIVALLCARLPEAVIEYVQRDEDPRDYRVNFDKIKDCLGFEPRNTVASGIEEVLSALRMGLIKNWMDDRYRN